MHNRHRLLHHSHYSCICISIFQILCTVSCTRCISSTPVPVSSGLIQYLLHLYPLSAYTYVLPLYCTHCPSSVAIPLVSFINISVSIVLIQYLLSTPPVSVSTVLIGNLRGFVPQDWWRQLCLIGKFILLLFLGYVYVHMYIVCMYVCVYIYVYLRFICISVYAFFLMYLCLWVCIFVGWVRVCILCVVCVCVWVKAVCQPARSFPFVIEIFYLSMYVFTHTYNTLRI